MAEYCVTVLPVSVGYYEATLIPSPSLFHNKERVDFLYV